MVQINKLKYINIYIYIYMEEKNGNLKIKLNININKCNCQQVGVNTSCMWSKIIDVLHEDFMF
jgi:hypothetical protein